MPPGRPCPICGRMFGTSSLDIHIPQCQSKTIQQWRNDPATRDRPLPTGLAQSLTGGGGGGGFGGRTATSMRGGSSQPSRFGSTTTSNNQQQHQQLPGPSSLSSKFGGFASTTSGNENQRVGGGAGRTTQNQNAPMMGAGPSQALNLVNCRYCSRHFSADRIGKHESVCIGSQKARKTFDTKAQRLKELMEDMNPRFAPKRKVGGGAPTRGGGMASTTSSYNPNKKDWRSEHREFQQMIRAAKADSRRSNQPQHSSVYGGGGNVSSSTRYNSRTTPMTTTSSKMSNNNNIRANGMMMPPSSSNSSRLGGTNINDNNNITNARATSMGLSSRTGITTNSRAPHGAGFVSREPVQRRAPSSSAGGGGGGGGSRFSGIRDMASGSPGGGGAPKQIGILPTNDTSPGMWSAMGREQPQYGSYGPIGNRGGAGARARAQQQNSSTGFW